MTAKTWVIEMFPGAGSVYIWDNKYRLWTTDPDAGTEFTDEQRKTLKLPADGHWAPADEKYIR